MMTRARRPVNLGNILDSSDLPPGVRKTIEEYVAKHDRLLIYNERLEKALGALSHDIRTPLNVIHGFAELLYENEISDERKEELEVVISRTEYLTSLADNHLDILKINARHVDKESKHSSPDSATKSKEIFGPEYAPLVVYIAEHDRLIIFNETLEKVLETLSDNMAASLDIILDNVGSLSDKPGLDNDYKQQLKDMETSAKYLLSLVNTYSNFSKIRAGQLNIKSEPYSLEKLFSDIESNAKMLLHKKGKKDVEVIKKEIPESISTYIETDPTLLQQIMNNLVGNSAKFTDEGYIKIGVSLKDSRLGFYVTDTGPGIPPEKQEAIFRPFQQADKSIEGRYGGHGLGLAITEELVGLMRGEIRVESEPEKGTTFYVELPYKPAK